MRRVLHTALSGRGPRSHNGIVTARTALHSRPGSPRGGFLLLLPSACQRPITSDMKELRTANLDIRLAPAELERARKIADREALPVSTWARQQLLRIMALAAHEPARVGRK
jgi:hypothetical protein